MTLTIEISPEIEARLRREAHRKGIEVIEYASRLIASNLPSTGEPALANLMQSWVNQDASDDTDEMEAREAKLQDFKAGMNANRAATGERPVYR